MKLNIKPNLLLKSNTLTKLFKNLYGVVIVIIFFVFVWLIYFIFQNLYQTIINPKEIKSEEVIAKEEKINLQLFDDVTKKLENKKQPSQTDYNKLTNPF